MKKMILSLTILGVLISLLTGCNTTTSNSISMNYQKSFLRSAGDSSATILLENYDNIESLKIIHVADIIIKYIEETNIDNIKKDELIAKLSEKIPYENLKKLAFSIVNKLPDTIDMKDAKKLIIAYCKGLKIGAEEFSIEDKIKKISN